MTTERQMPYFPDMPELSLKKLDESLMRAVKVEAAKQGLSMRDFVIKALTMAVGWERPPEAPKKSRKSQKMGIEVPDWRAIEEKVTRELDAETPVGTEVPLPVYFRQPHDPKTCHINKCFMCEAMK